ncbi:MAG: hypothetical protein KC417_09360, partial [Myxococcales bacterium]|nr:hypothetical protein [Myxococcales bacterium]
VGGAVALADDAATHGEVLIVLAKEEAGEIDPALKDMPALRRPPFSAFKSMKLLGRPPISLVPKKPTEVDLPNGRKLQIILESTLPDGRFRVRVSINRPEKKDYLPLLQVIASPGDPFFVAGQSHQGGTLVIGVRVGDKPAKP